jgi:putative tricarboxylic transport membrane protein
MTIRQSLFGVFFGAIPGVGSGVIDWMSYALGIAFTKDKSQFGKGSLEGVLFAEAAQNSKEGGQAIPTLALGIPGGRSWAFVMLGMMSYGHHYHDCPQPWPG